jgi:flagellar biosynthesis protein FlhG
MTAVLSAKPDRAPQALRPARRLTIASGKGGVGKTWMAVTLAQAFAFRGERVLLVDGDLGLANVDVQLGLEPRADLAAVIAGEVPLEAAVSPYGGGPAAAAGGGFDVLPGRSGAGTLAGLAEDELQALACGLTGLEAAYDRVLVDLGAGLDRVVTTLCTADHGSKGHAILVVLTSEPTSLTDAYAFIKVIRMRTENADLRVIVNRAQSTAEGKRTHQALATATQNFLGFAPPLMGIIPDDGKVPDSIRHQTALMLRHPQSKAGMSMMALAKTLCGG